MLCSTTGRTWLYISVIIKHFLKRSQPESDFNPAHNDLSILDGRINEFVHEEDQNADIRQNVNEFDVQLAVPLPNFSVPAPKIELQPDRQRQTKFEETNEAFNPIREVNFFNNPTVVNNFDNDLSNFVPDRHPTVNTAVGSQERPRSPSQFGGESDFTSQFGGQSLSQSDFTFSSLPSRFASPEPKGQQYFFGPPQQTINMRDGSYTIITVLD